MLLIAKNRFLNVFSFAKNTVGDDGINFKIEYQAADGNIREYFPDFFVKTSDENVLIVETIFIVETKGRENLDDIRKVKRLAQWCKDVNVRQNEKNYTVIYIKQEDWEKYQVNLKSFYDVKAIFLAD